jgi:preprotein translocase subunit SecG
MDFGGNPKTRLLLIALVVAAAAVIAWFLLTNLFRLVPGIALPLLLLTALFLIVLVLIQRGKGGGLAGAFGGLGGQSAFGTKAGDLFTRVTMGVALFWIILCMATVNVLGTPQDILKEDLGEANPITQGPASQSSQEKTGRTADQTPAEKPGPLSTPHTSP